MVKLKIGNDDKINLYRKYGEYSTVCKIVTDFYEIMEKNPLTAPFFKNLDMERIFDHQIDFITQALGGPKKYFGKSMKNAHSNLDINDEVFYETLNILDIVLDKHHVEADDKEAIINIIKELKDDIVGH